MRRDLPLWKIETSKLILIVSYVITIILTIITIVGVFYEFDMTQVAEITLASYAEVSASNIFYYKKAARENVLKIKKDLINDIDINQLL